MKLSYQRKEWVQFLVGCLATAFQIWAMLVVAFNEVMLGLSFILTRYRILPQGEKRKNEPITTSPSRQDFIDRRVTTIGLIASVLFVTGILHV